MSRRIPLFMKSIPREKVNKGPLDRWRIVRGDWVEVLNGKEAGKQGEIEKVDRKNQKVFVKGLNLQAVRKKGETGKKGSITYFPGPIHYSNVNLVDPSTGRKTKIGIRFLEDGTKVRASKATGTLIPKPERKINMELKDLGAKDTPSDLAWEVTYTGP